MPQKSLKELGRSMVEMLGVLAIVGVLSIAAIFGYSFAINKYKANSTIEELTRRALIVSMQMSGQNSALQMDELGYTTHMGYLVRAVRLQNPTTSFDLILENVPPNVCQQILKSDWKYPIMIKVNDITYQSNTAICETDAEMIPTMAFQFDETLDAAAKPSGYCDSDSECSGCDKCQNNKCITSCTGEDRCSTDYDTGIELCCPKDKRLGGYCCASVKNGMCCNSSGQCCPWYKPLMGSLGTCYPCDQATYIDVTGMAQNCAVCSQRELLGTRCLLKCPPEKPMRDAYYACRGCDEPAFNQVGNTKDCKKCPNRVLVGSNCALACGQGIYKDKPVMDINANCHACDEPGNFRMDNSMNDQCSLCQDRELVGDMCAKKCPPERPLPGINGTCYACDEPKPVTISGVKGACDVCPNRIFGGLWDGYCYLPCGQGDTKDRPLTDFIGVCYSCDEKNAVNVTNVTQNCSVCNNRELIGSSCSLKTKCPVDKPLKALNGTCYTCDEEKPVNSLPTQCWVCQNRFFENNWCSLPCGNGIYKDKPLRGANGVCYSCNDPQDIYMGAGTQANCRVCNNREISINDYCVLKK